MNRMPGAEDERAVPMEKRPAREPPRTRPPAGLPPPPGPLRWAAWLLATALGGLAYMTILSGLTSLVHSPSSALTEWPGAALLAVATALLAQWVLLRLYLGLVSPWRWVAAGLLGWVVYGALVWGLWLGVMLLTWGGGANLAAPVGALAGLLGGAALGGLQAGVLQPYLPRRAWIGANAAGGALAGALGLGTFMRAWTDIGTPGLLPDSATPYGQGNVAQAVTVILLALGAVTAVVFARYTGGAAAAAPPGGRPARPRDALWGLAGLGVLLALWAGGAAGAVLSEQRFTMAAGPPDVAVGPPECGTWHSIIGPAMGDSGGWRAISAAAANDIWAVGSRPRQWPVADTIVTHWDGTSWMQVALPQEIVDAGVYLNTILTPASADAWAAGGSTILHWDGQEWSRSPAPDLAARHYSDVQLMALGAGAAHDVWVVSSYGGNTLRPLALHWNGTSWQVAPLPEVSGGHLAAVRVFAPDDVWAAGSMSASAGLDYPERFPLVMHWDGRAWTVVLDGHHPLLAGQPGELSAVDGTSAGNLWAVGRTLDRRGTGSTLLLHRDGQEWGVIGTPPEEESWLNDVAAPAADDVWLVGGVARRDPPQEGAITSYRALVLHWDGHAWRRVTDPPAKSDQELVSVAAVGRNEIWIAGTTSDRRYTAPSYGVLVRFQRATPCGAP